MHSEDSKDIEEIPNRGAGAGEESDDPTGTRVGIYRLIRRLGGDDARPIFLAERADGEFSQRVAVKFIRRGADTERIVRRFRKERQTLAALEHPFIARLLDGGTTGDGLPYFVTEYVEGRPLYRFCDEQKLDLDQRLRLFLKICAAVSAAHDRKVIHCDLEPDNILVTESGNPKLLNFGIARLLDPDLIHVSLNPATREGFSALEYASPEQVRGSDITPASDIYSLGVLLYELLTGRSPYSIGDLPTFELSRIICEDSPAPPSVAVGQSGNFLSFYGGRNFTAEQIAGLRRSSVERVADDLRGNLDNIILKALDKSPEKRFQSVREFAEDIDKHLNGSVIITKADAEPETTRGGERNEKTSATGGAAKSIAVLPLKFLNPSQDESEDSRFLGLGLADTLITRLSSVQRFVVRPTGSILRYGESGQDSFAAGRELDVEYVLDGNILQAGERLRVSVQLLKIADKSTIWAERFDEKIGDVLYLEDVISTRVAESLIPRLTAEEREGLAKRGTDNPKAFEMYMRGRTFWARFTPEGFLNAIEAYESAIRLDPDYALAFAGLADDYNWLGVYGVLQPFDCFQKAKNLARRAIELDEELSEAHAALGFAAVAGGYDWALGESENLRALELNPNNAAAHVWYALQLFMESRFAEGEYHARRGAQLDPLTPYNVFNVGWCLYFARRYEESLRQFRRTISLFPGYPLAHYGLSWALRITGKHEAAIAAAETFVRMLGENPFSLTLLAQAFAAAGNEQQAREILARLGTEYANEYVSPYQLAVIYCFLNEKQNALTELENALESKEAWLAWMGVEPVFDRLRGEVKFVRLMNITGNPNVKRLNASYDDSAAISSKAARTGEMREKETGELPTVSAPARSGASLPLALIVFLILAGAAAYYFLTR